jgi:hypothetical protein
VGTGKIPRFFADDGTGVFQKLNPDSDLIGQPDVLCSVEWRSNDEKMSRHQRHDQVTFKSGKPEDTTRRKS